MSLEVGKNSWISEEDANIYLEDRLDASEYWASGVEKDKALITAYRQLNGCGYFEFPSTSSQVMKDAQCEQALFLLIHQKDIDKRKGLQAQGVVSAGIVKEGYDRDMLMKVPIAPIVTQMLEDYSAEGKPLYASDLKRDEEEDVI